MEGASHEIAGQARNDDDYGNGKEVNGIEGFCACALLHAQ
jgi:hypothetical protein